MRILARSMIVTIAAASAACAPAQTLLYTFGWSSGLDPTRAYGVGLAAGGDVNGDGVPDIAVGAPSLNPAVGGIVELRSGADGSLLQTWNDAGSPSFGRGVAFVGDTNGDGVDDLVVTLGSAASAGVYSGADGSLLVTLLPASYGNPDPLGHIVVATGDVDGDGVSEVAVGEQGTSVPPSGICPSYELPGLMRLFSPVSGSMLRSWLVGGNPANGTGGGPGSPSAIVRHADLTSDGIDEIVVASPGYPGQGPGGFWCPGTGSSTPSIVRVFDPTAPASLMAIAGPVVADLQVASLRGDVNGDSVPDLIAATPGLIATISGSNLSPITGILATSTLRCVPIGDQNQDGLPDAALARPGQIVMRSGGGLGLLGQISGLPLTSGEELVSLGDLNGDGVLEFAVSDDLFDVVWVYSPLTLAAASATALGTGCGAGPFVPPVLAITPPVLGGVLTFDVNGAAAQSPGVLMVSIGPSPLSGGACAWFIDWSTAFPLFTLSTDALGGWSLATPLPLAIPLAGAELASQCVVWTSAGGTSSNGVNLVLGF